MYASSAAIETGMAMIADALPQFAELIELPEPTIQGRRVHALKLTAGPAPETERASALFIAGTHARELMNPDALLDLALDLIETYVNGNDLRYGRQTFPGDRVRAMMNALNVWLVPNINPDGREYALNVDDLWRNNRRETAGALGVNINRNLDILWGVTTRATSCNPMRDDYAGTAPHSEPETRNIVSLLEAYPIDCMVDVHSYTNKVLFPWGHAPTQTSDRSQVFTRLTATPCEPLFPATHSEFMRAEDVTTLRAMCSDAADAMRSVQGQPYIAHPSVDLYPTTGTFDDYGYSRHIADPAAHKTLSLTFECGPNTRDPRTSFHPDDPTAIRAEAKSGLVTVAINCAGRLDLPVRSILMTVDFDGRDDENFASDEVVDPRATVVPINPSTPPSPLVYRWGGELRAEYTFQTTLHASGQVDLRSECLLFEGTSESTRDLDGTGTIELSAAEGAWAEATFLTTNTDEGDEDDFGRLRIVLQNNPRGMLSLFSMWHQGRADNHTSANPLLARPRDHRPDGYALYRRHGHIFAPTEPRPRGTRPLVSWWNTTTRDNWITTDPSMAGAVGSRRAGYVLYRLDGYVYSPESPQPAGTDALITWFHAGRQDHLTTTDPRWQHPIGTRREGYLAIRLEGYVQRL